MNVRELTFKGEDEVRLFACGECGRCVSPKLFLAPKDVQMQTARRMAEECCAVKTCTDCGVDMGQTARTICDACHERRILKNATEMYDANVVVYQYGGEGSWGEGYSENIEELFSWCHGYDEPVPAYVHPCEGDPLRLDADNILVNVVDDHHPDAGDQVVDAQEFRDFVEKWNAKQTCVSYAPDYSKVIVLKREAFDEIINPPATDEGDETEKEDT